MEHLAEIRLQNVRVHRDFTLPLSPTVTVITGANGSGKTSLIEGLYIALRGTSFKGSDSEVIARGESWYRIDTMFTDGFKRTVKFDTAKQTGRKQFTIDGETHYRLPARHKYPVVLFEPDDLRLLNGSPARRREFIDRFISQLDPKYASSLSRYERALKQRNALLKQEVSDDTLFVWNIALSEYGAYIMHRRVHLINMLNAQLQQMYYSIADTKDVVTMSYSEVAGEALQQQLLGELHARAGRDKRMGFTSVGPHRHDILFHFNTAPATTVASRGEVRSVVLALKFLEVGIITEITGKNPIILLDDVFSELDETRQARLASGILHNQTIITTTTAMAIKKARLVNLG